MDSEMECKDSIEDFVSNYSKDDHTVSNDKSLYYFETDYLPLKGNLDYLRLMKTLAVLDAQRVKVCKDIADLEELKLRSIDKPFEVKKDILEGKLTCLNPCKIEKVPDIDFSKYSSLSNSNKKLSTRRKTTRHGGPKEEEHTRPSTEIRVRGRVYNEKKPQSFNQLWSVEEQLRLEQLLLEIPPENVEYRRWEKIAEALGSRTAQQVCSRVQKYFKKLSKAGISSTGINKKNNSKKRAYYIHKQHKHYLYKPSTFFPGAAMGELEQTDSEGESGKETKDDLSHWPDIYKKINEEKDNNLKVEHVGFQCQNCRKDPITGIRWECKSCPTVSFCSDCMSNLCIMTPPPHPINHHFRFVDLYNNISYTTDAFSCDNYLDPNAHLM